MLSFIFSALFFLSLFSSSYLGYFDLTNKYNQNVHKNCPTVIFWIKRFENFGNRFIIGTQSLEIKHVLKCNIHVSNFNLGLILRHNFQLIHFFFLILFFLFFIQYLAINDCTIWQFLKYTHLLFQQHFDFFVLQKIDF